MGGPERPKYDWQTTRIIKHSSIVTRRKFLGGAVAILAGAAIGMAEVKGGAISNFIEAVSGDRLTADQIEYAGKMKHALESETPLRLVKNLVVEQIDENGNPGKVRVRNKPSTYAFEGDPRGGSEIAILDHEAVIDYALEVLDGNDPQNPKDRRKNSKWYAFVVPGKDYIGFSHNRNFKPTSFQRT